MVEAYKAAYGEEMRLWSLRLGNDNADPSREATRKGLVSALGTQPVPVAVKGLEWEDDWSGSNEDIPSWRGKNPLGLHVSVCFAGRLFNGAQIERHDDAPVDVLEAAKAAAQAEYEAHIRSAIAPATQLVPGAMVEALRFYANEKNWTAGRWPDDLDELVEGLICIDWQHEEGGSIPFADCGDRARAAIAAAPATQAVPGDMAETIALIRKRMKSGECDLRDVGKILTGRWDQDVPAAILAALTAALRLRAQP